MLREQPNLGKNKRVEVVVEILILIEVNQQQTNTIISYPLMMPHRMNNKEIKTLKK
jgi:hypothetical protein